jgi:hypothetical protein
MTRADSLLDNGTQKELMCLGDKITAQIPTLAAQWLVFAASLWKSASRKPSKMLLISRTISSKALPDRCLTITHLSLKESRNASEYLLGF